MRKVDRRRCNERRAWETICHGEVLERGMALVLVEGALLVAGAPRGLSGLADGA